MLLRYQGGHVMDNAIVTKRRQAGAGALQVGSSQLPLSFVGTGCVATIAKVRGKCDLQHHLETLGFVEGAQVKVVSEQAGDLIVEVKGSQVALNRQVAIHIITA